MSLKISFFCCFWLYLHQIFTKFKKQGQFWNLLALRIPKLTLLLNFGQLEAEKMKAKDTSGQFHFSNNYERNYQVSLVVITLWDFQNFNFTFGITFCDILHTNIQAFNKKLQKKLIFCIFLKLQRKMTENNLKMWMTPGVFCLHFLSFQLAKIQR